MFSKNELEVHFLSDGAILINPLKFTDPSGYYPKELGDHPTPAFSGYNLDQLILSEGGFGGGGSGSYYYTKIFGRGDITYNWYSGNYQYDNGEIATYDQAMNQLYSNTRSNDISTISGSSLFGYDHLYSLSINGQLRLAGSIGGEITGLVRGHFVVTNNAFSAVLAANGEVTVWGVDVSEQGILDIKDWFQIGLGTAGTYFDVKGNALHNQLYWKGKTTDKFYFKNPFTKKITIGWKANSFKATAKAFQGAKSLGTKLGVAGLLITGTDILFGDGLTTSNALDAAFGIAGFLPGIGWAISGTYFVVNTGVLLYTGKSIGENLDE